MEPTAKSLNSGDVFLLVTPKEIHLWNGKDASIMKKAKVKYYVYVPINADQEVEGEGWGWYGGGETRDMILAERFSVQMYPWPGHLPLSAIKM